MTVFELRSLLDKYYHNYRIVEYWRAAAVLIYIDMEAVRTDIAAEIEAHRHVGVLIHIQPANWFQRWAWQLGIWKYRGHVIK